MNSIMEAENLSKMLIRAIRKVSKKIKLDSVPGNHMNGDVVDYKGRKLNLAFWLVHKFEISDDFLCDDRKLRAEINKCIKVMMFTYKENAQKVVVFGCMAKQGNRNGTRNFATNSGSVNVKVSAFYNAKKSETEVKMEFIFGTFTPKEK